MRVASKWLALMAVVAGAVLIGPAMASAQSGIEVWNVDEDVTCDSATGGHCIFYAEGESEIFALPGEILVSDCQDEFFGEIQSDGTGVVEWIGTSNGSPGCGVINCETGDEASWPILSTTETDTGQVSMVVRLCLRALPPITTELHCNVNLSIGAPGDPHDYVFTTSTLCGGGSRRYEGDWHIESLPLLTDEIELVHL